MAVGNRLRTLLISPLAIACCLNVLLFLLFIGLTSPIYNTVEDVHILYMVSGGFAAPPTALLHYNYGIHPILGSVTKSLFELIPHVNWYSIALLAGHLLACIVICHQLIVFRDKRNGSLIFLAWFIVFESRLLLEINFTSTALTLGCAGLFIVYRSVAGKKEPFCTATAIALLLSASLYRIHVLIPLAGITIPFLITPPYRKTIVKTSLLLATIAVAILLFNILQQNIYRSNIKNWEPEEKYRQEIYAFYNNNHLHQPSPGEPWYTEFALINNGLPIDSSFLGIPILKKMQEDLSIVKNTNNRTTNSKNWFWINNRIFFLALLFIILFSRLSRAQHIRLCCSLVLTITGFWYLYSTAKLPDYLVTGAFMHIFLMTGIVSTSGKQQPVILKYLQYLFAGMLIAWGLVRIYKINKDNVLATKNFKQEYNLINKQQDMLYIDAGDSFRLQKFFIWDLPANYRLPNYLDSEHFLQHQYQAILKKYHVGHFTAIPDNDNILFFGKRLPALENYFIRTNNRAVTTETIHRISDQKEIYRIRFAEKNQ